MNWFPSSLLLTIQCRFGWAACQLDTLRRSVPEDISQALNELPAAMDEKYMRVLEKIPKEKRERAHYLLQCLVASVRPLRIEELEEISVLRFDRGALHKQKKVPRRKDSLLSACSSLVNIVQAEDSHILQFSHFSVEQFLTSTRLAEDGNLSCYHIPLEPAHTILAEACLTVLFQDKVDDQRIGGSPLSTYAAQHWFIHTQFGNVATQPQIQPLVQDLFDANKPHFRGWIRLHDMDVEGEQAARNSMDRLWQPTVTPLYYAVLCKLPHLVNYLIEERPEYINVKGGSHGTALHAALQKDFTIAETLLGHGADVDARDKSNRRPLEKVLDDDHIEALRLLIEHKANVNAVDQRGWTPLRRASANGQLQVVQLLLQKGAEIKAADALGWTALHLASFNGHVKVTKLLLENAANVNALTKGEFTPLYVASSRGLIDVVQLLLRFGADVRLRGTGNQSPLRVAFTQEHYKVAKLLAGNSEGW
jgi:ankyrin repeat protein